jgi:small subunit ribosomal protein S14
MSKKSVSARQTKRERIVKKYEARRKALKEAIRQAYLQGELPDTLALQKLPRDSSPTRLRNRCRLTGRPRGYLRQFGLCRNKFRELALEGKIPGIRKASW